jgi:hypothetical protein
MRAICLRHLHDLDTAPAAGYVWRPDLAEEAITFCQWVNGEPLPAWQAFMVGFMTGWVDDRGAPRYPARYRPKFTGT